MTPETICKQNFNDLSFMRRHYTQEFSIKIIFQTKKKIGILKKYHVKCFQNKRCGDEYEDIEKTKGSSRGQFSNPISAFLCFLLCSKTPRLNPRAFMFLRTILPAHNLKNESLHLSIMCLRILKSSFVYIQYTIVCINIFKINVCSATTHAF